MFAPLTIIETLNDAQFTSRSASMITDIIRSSIAQNDRALIGLSGGKTPGAIYDAVGQSSDIDWSKVWLFLVDDRYIRKDSPHSNQFLLHSTWLRHAPIPESQLLFPNTTLKLEECIDEYERVILDVFRRHTPDLLVLGMGTDGHIASLFAPLPEEASSKRAVIRTTTDRFEIYHRITLTLTALAKAKQALFLLKGKDKKEIWEEMIKSTDDEKRWPGKGIMKHMGTTMVIAP